MTGNNEFESRSPGKPYVDVRPARRVRLIDHGGTVVAYPEPHRTPVLPSGWAPLTREQQDAVLQACDAAPQCALLRLGSLWDPEAEYRVYRLTDERWAGLWVACRFVATVHSGSGSSWGENRQLLGLSPDAALTLQLTMDFFNWDLETYGEGWRLAIENPPAPADPDARRV